MSQQTSFLALGCMTKLTRADRFLEEMDRVVPWAELVAVIAPHYPVATLGRKATDLLLLLHCLQLWYNLSDPALEDAVHDRLSFQRFLKLDPLTQTVPHERPFCTFGTCWSSTVWPKRSLPGCARSWSSVASC